MATSLEESEKLVRIDNIHANTFYFKTVKIGPLDPEIALRNLKKRKNWEVKYISFQHWKLI